MDGGYNVGITITSFVISQSVHTLRRWRRRRAFASTAILVLALGIGATTAIFSLVDAVLLRPLPWPAAERLVAIYSVVPERRSNPATAANWNRGLISWAAWDEMRRAPEFDDVGVWFPSRFIFGLPAEDAVEGRYVSASYFSVLSAHSALGRLFRSDEDREPSDGVIISHYCWQRRYGGRPDVVGQKAVLALAPGEEEVKTVVGVLPADFRVQGTPPEFFLPMGLRAMLAGSPQVSHHATGRLAANVSPEVAEASAGAIIARTSTGERGLSGRVVSLRDDLLGISAPPLWLLFGGAGLLLLIACANVVGLLLGEAYSRTHEMSVRVALGANARHILQQLAVEHALLAMAGGVAGLIFAVCLTPAFVSMAPPELPGVGTATVNPRAAAFALTLGIMTVVVFGFAPAVVLSSTRAVDGLSGSLRDGSLRRYRAQRLIVAIELGFAFVLVVCAMLFGQTIASLTSRPLGFDPSDLAVVSIKATQIPATQPAPGQMPLFTSWMHTAGLIERVEAVPGVLSAAGVGTAPFLGGWRSERIRTEQQSSGDAQSVHVQVVTESYLRTMRLPLLDGRWLQFGDRQAGMGDRQRRAVISRELERRFFGHKGVQQRLIRDAASGTVGYEVVGVVANTKQREFSDDNPATLYLLDSTYSSINDLVIRTSGDATAALPSIIEALRDYDPHTVVTRTSTMEALLAESVSEERFRAALSIIFGTAALLLASVALYGSAARHVTERQREIGVRMALGAGPGDVRRLVLTDAGVTVAIGLGIGLPSGLATAHLVRAWLFGLSPLAPEVLMLAAIALSFSAAIAMLGPAHRATRIDPVLVLREGGSDSRS